MQAGVAQISAAQICTIQARLAEVGALKFGFFKVRILELGVYEIHVCKLALPALLCLEKLDQGRVASRCSWGRWGRTDEGERQP